MTAHPIAFTENPAITASRDGSRVVSWVRAHPIVALCVWFYPVAWAIALLPLVVQRPFSVEVPQGVFNSAATLLGGILPVIVITRLVDGPAGLVALARRLAVLPSRGAIGWYALVLLALPILCLVLAALIFGPPNVTLSAGISAVVNGLLLQTILTLLMTVLWEEVQWRGFVQARLQAQRGVMTAAVITGILFGLQHVPLFIEQQQNAVGLIIFVVFVALSILFRTVTGWIYNTTGSLLLVALLHATGDATASGPFAPGFLSRLYGDQGAAPFQLLVLALIGLVVIAATRARLGVAAGTAPLAQAKPAIA